MKQIHYTIKSSDELHRPDIFSRGALEFTFRLLRHHSPSLALAVQNVLAGNILTLDSPLHSTPPSRTSDHFMVYVDAHTVGKVVAALTEIGQQALANKQRQDSGQLIVLRTLIQEWASLTEWLLENAESNAANYS